MRKNALVYMNWEERTGKSLTACLIAEEAAVINILIVTKPKPAVHWKKMLEDWKHNKIYKVITYYELDKFKPSSSVYDDFDLIILDECHNFISSLPNLPPKWKYVRRLTRGKPIIYMSATPCAQTPGQLFHQFCLSDWHPWRKYSTYKEWHKEYGEPYTAYLYQKQIEMFDRVDDNKVLAETNYLFHTKTRKDVEFEHEPDDKIHYITLDSETKITYNLMLKHKVFHVEPELSIEYDTTAKLRAGLHMLEGGTLKYTTYKLNKNNKPTPSVTHFDMGNREKIDYIREHWGDNQNVAIMYNYIGEGKLLNKLFHNAAILQATTHAEGIDLMDYEHLIIYSQDFSTARHTQRRARQTNMERDIPITVHFLLVKDAISDQVYDTVSINKVNYVDEFFKRKRI